MESESGYLENESGYMAFIKEGIDMSATLRINSFNKTNFGLAPVTIVVMEYPPYSSITQRLPTGIEGKGETWMALEALKTFFNFTPVIRIAQSVDDLVEKLKNEEADMTLIPLVMTEERQRTLDFSEPVVNSMFGMLVKRPEYTPKPDALLKPFRFDVWIYILMALGIMGPLIYLISRLRFRLCKMGSHKLISYFSLQQCVWFVFGALLKQGSVLQPRADCARILFASWWMFIVIVTAFYTANLTAFLTFNGLELAITSVKSLSSHPELSWLAPPNEALVAFIQGEPDMGVLREMESEGRGEFMNNTAEALEKVRNGTHVYLEDYRVLEYLISYDYNQFRLRGEGSCHFYTAPLEDAEGNVDPQHLFYSAFAFRKNFTYKEDFNLYFKTLLRYGILNYHQNLLYSKGKICDLPKGFKDRPLENRDLKTTYFMVLFGGLFSAFSFVVEFCFGKRKNLVGLDSEGAPQGSTQAPSWNSENRFIPYSTWNPKRHQPPRRSRPKTPFAIKYPEYAQDPNYRVFPSMYTYNQVDFPIHALRAKPTTSGDSRESGNSHFLERVDKRTNRTKRGSGQLLQGAQPTRRTSYKNANSRRTLKDLRKTELTLLTAPFTEEEILQERRLNGLDSILEGSVRGLHVLWDRKENKLLVKDKNKLEQSITYDENGVPCVYMESIVNNEPKYQKLVLTNYRS